MSPAIFNGLKGLRLESDDEFKLFQKDFAVYHDDIGDYSTNEPTMDGTADAIFLKTILPIRQHIWKFDELR